MKNILKKVSAFALALTLISGSTAIAKNIDPKFDNAIVASAIKPVSNWRYSFSFYSATLYHKGGCEYFSSGDRYTAYKYEVFAGMYMGRNVNVCKINKYVLYLDSDGVSRWRYDSTEYYEDGIFWNIDRA